MITAAGGKEISAAMATFLDQPGVPLVEARHEANRVSLSQTRSLHLNPNQVSLNQIRSLHLHLNLAQIHTCP